jgi:hypothetical protein
LPYIEEACIEYIYLSVPFHESVFFCLFPKSTFKNISFFQPKNAITLSQLSLSLLDSFFPPSTAKMHSLLALPIILLSSFALATPLDERQNACLQCTPFPTPGDNSRQCDATTSCVPQPGRRTYCACRGGYRGSGGYRPGDTSVQVSSTACEYLYISTQPV